MTVTGAKRWVDLSFFARKSGRGANETDLSPGANFAKLLPLTSAASCETLCPVARAIRNAAFLSMFIGEGFNEYVGDSSRERTLGRDHNAGCLLSLGR